MCREAVALCAFVVNRSSDFRKAQRFLDGGFTLVLQTLRLFKTGLYLRNVPVITLGPLGKHRSVLGNFS